MLFRVPGLYQIISKNPHSTFFEINLKQTSGGYHSSQSFSVFTHRGHCITNPKKCTNVKTTSNICIGNWCPPPQKKKWVPFNEPLFHWNFTPKKKLSNLGFCECRLLSLGISSNLQGLVIRWGLLSWNVDSYRFFLEISMKYLWSTYGIRIKYLWNTYNSGSMFKNTKHRWNCVHIHLLSIVFSTVFHVIWSMYRYTTVPRFPVSKTQPWESNPTLVAADVQK